MVSSARFPRPGNRGTGITGPPSDHRLPRCRGSAVCRRSRARARGSGEVPANGGRHPHSPVPVARGGGDGIPGAPGDDALPRRGWRRARERRGDPGPRDRARRRRPGVRAVRRAMAPRPATLVLPDCVAAPSHRPVRERGRHASAGELRSSPRRAYRAQEAAERAPSAAPCPRRDEGTDTFPRGGSRSRAPPAGSEESREAYPAEAKEVLTPARPRDAGLSPGRRPAPWPRPWPRRPRR